jgi:glutamine synthetase type III
MCLKRLKTRPAPPKLIKELITEHQRVIFNGDNYTKPGLKRLHAGVFLT